MTNPEPEAEPVIPPTVPDRDLDDTDGSDDRENARRSG